MRFRKLRIPLVDVSCRALLLLACASVFTGASIAEPLSKRNEIDFFRDVPSRNLKGLATRSDGRLVAGPMLVELPGPAPADLLWTLEATPDPAKWLVGTGPDGRIVEVTLNLERPAFTARDYAKLEDPQVFAVKRLPDGTVLAGTSPKGALYLIRDEKPVARALLPVDSIFDLLVLDANTALAATGNPGRIYKIDLEKFATVGLIADKITDTKILADRGITLFGEVRDRNVRRLAKLTDGRLAAGSAPKGNIYLFPPSGGAPVILQENRDAEVTDLLPAPNGGLYATMVFSGTTGEARITPPASAAKGGAAREPRDETPPAVQVERFGGRSTLVWFPADGFPETLASRANTAFYRVVRHDDLLIISGGEQGELVGYDLKKRLALTFSGSISAQLNALAPLTADGGRFLALRNNAPGFALLNFATTGLREAETRRIDLGTPARIGALRFNRLRDIGEANLLPEIRTSNGSDEVEGWGPWVQLRPEPDGGWRADALRGRYAKLRIRIADAPATSAPGTPPAPPVAPGAPSAGKKKTPPAKSATAPTPAATAGAAPAAAIPPSGGGLEVDRAALYVLPQNRRPLLQDFRVLTPGFSVLPAAEQPPSPIVSISRLIDPPRADDDRRRSSFLGSQVVPSPGTQVVLWTVSDPDGDSLVSTFSIRRDGETDWIDVAAATRDGYAQFDTSHLPDGVYFTRLVISETAPRPVADRLTHSFETDDLIVDHTPPEILEASARRTAEAVVVSVRGRDRLSLLDGIEVVFNNGVRETLAQPLDGVRDGREETFTLDVPLARISNATSVEVTLYDRAGKGTTRRLTW